MGVVEMLKEKVEKKGGEGQVSGRGVSYETKGKINSSHSLVSFLSQDASLLRGITSSLNQNPFLRRCAVQRVLLFPNETHPSVSFRIFQQPFPSHSAFVSFLNQHIPLLPSMVIKMSVHPKSLQDSLIKDLRPEINLDPKNFSHILFAFEHPADLSPVPRSQSTFSSSVIDWKVAVREGLLTEDHEELEGGNQPEDLISRASHKIRESLLYLGLWDASSITPTKTRKPT
eukprot:TRINITY_DN5184_c0_g1_i2.p1 TRINITY_DN5184_c0_g1~~TRINITY_DN5184_c0_g1_i2.p1  ORF type:complete len:229 (-),score=72.75 TRINITY_DN5184_c0_g1_i2:226-912(-)